jgi:hypothetical protein
MNVGAREVGNAMYARVTTGTFPEDRMKDLRQVIEQIEPRTRDIPGFKNLFAMADDATGKLVAVILYETEGDLVASRETATKLREEVAKAAGGTISSVEEFEVIAQV